MFSRRVLTTRDAASVFVRPVAPVRATSRTSARTPGTTWIYPTILLSDGALWNSNIYFLLDELWYIQMYVINPWWVFGRYNRMWYPQTCLGGTPQHVLFHKMMRFAGISLSNSFRRQFYQWAKTDYPLTMKESAKLMRWTRPRTRTNCEVIVHRSSQPSFMEIA